MPGPSGTVLALASRIFLQRFGHYWWFDLLADWTIIVRVLKRETLEGWTTPPPILIAGGHFPNAMCPSILGSLMTFPRSLRLIYKFCLLVICWVSLISLVRWVMGSTMVRIARITHSTIFFPSRTRKPVSSFWKKLFRRITILIYYWNSYVLHWQ